ncbi:MAG: cob(I)yrinic acid a,c-diamide adenosyltransferase [Candidatus Wallbacteria bacterium]|nr:cob(I)yrinic acid a,c-diamide adenosyltransferase [Candidatus Wallbacteria bacterium]
MKIYTKTGDGGSTGLFGGTRVSKGSARIAAYGDVDELNSALGLARAELAAPGQPAALAELDAPLERAQNELFHLGAELATAPEKLELLPAGSRLAVGAESWMEPVIDRAFEQMPPIRAFVLPGGTRLAAQLHVARTVCRRAERALAVLDALEPIVPALGVYLNRLSDLLFSLARLANHHAGVSETRWSVR